jgi:dihydroxyacid dehydratase/phosphogluconate dehydratase
MDALWRHIPLLADIQPCGARLIQHFRSAGGVAAVMRALGPAVDHDVLAADGRRWSEHAAEAESDGRAARTVRTPDDPVADAPVLASLFGSLAPDGAVIKVAASSPRLHSHRGPALVFDGHDEMRTRLDRDDLDVSPDHVLVVRGCGPKGAPGMPEWAMAPIPRPLVARGVRDMLRVSDGRMSGTSYGTVILHVAPESAASGPLALVRDGDIIDFDLAARRIDLDVGERELTCRRSAARPRVSPHVRGWPKLYQDHVTQAPDGCDMDFLTLPADHPVAMIDPVVGRS